MLTLMTGGAEFLGNELVATGRLRNLPKRRVWFLQRVAQCSKAYGTRELAALAINGIETMAFLE